MTESIVLTASGVTPLLKYSNKQILPCVCSSQVTSLIRNRFGGEMDLLFFLLFFDDRLLLRNQVLELLLVPKIYTVSSCCLLFVDMNPISCQERRGGNETTILLLHIVRVMRATVYCWNVFFPSFLVCACVVGRNSIYLAQSDMVPAIPSFSSSSFLVF